MLWIGFIAISLQHPLYAANLPDWVKTARIANAEPDVESDDAELNGIIALRKSENVSVLELDPGFSEYHNDAQYAARVNLIKNFTNKAHASGMKTVTYIPALEVNTVKGEILPNSMYKDHPDWIQKGFNGEPAVFYGSQEDWVEPQMESAWMSPNSGYRSYFLNRIKQMAASGIDGIWIDVPVYYGISNESWGGNESGAITAFKQWASNNGFGNVTAPTKINWDDKNFKLWIKWRHVNLATFIDDVRKAAQSVNPNIVLIDEVFPVDNMDSTTTGLDQSWRIGNDNHVNVWEVDSVSNTKAMKWSNQEDFINKITMYKWARGIDRENPSWGFSYGNEELDASLVMSAVVTAGVAPFESKTPGMTETVKSSFRKKWFGFIKDNDDTLLKQSRVANVGIWYSSTSRDYQDFKLGAGYGMYNTYKSPNNDPDWWAQEFTDTPLGKPHLGGYRGAAYALSKLHVPYKIVAAPSQPSQELQDVQFLWLPSVAAISDTDAATIKNFVQKGGFVLATGTEPGVMDENGKLRNESIFKDLFNLTSGALPAPRANQYGKGVAIYRSDILGKEFFPSDAGIELANENLSDLEQLVRIHADDLLIVKPQNEGIHVEVSQPSTSKHYLYMTNFSGLKLPLVTSPQNVDVQYHAPKGYEVASARVMTPDSNATIGSVGVKQTAQGWSGFTVKVNQFSLIELTLRKAPQVSIPKSPALKWASAERKEAAESGLNFILNKMRHSNKAAPYKYGVYTNFLNNGGLTDIYAHGHHVSAEHMGLTLRASACMGNQTAWNESYEYIRDAMADPMYSVVNWAIDRDRDAPLVSFDDAWLSANAPLDDFRVIRGLLDGFNKFGENNAEDLAQRLLTGMYNTTITDRNHKAKMDFPNYLDGLVGYAWDWSGTTDASLKPAAVASSIGKFSIDPIPVDYNDLYTMGEAAKRDPRWNATLNSAVDLLLNSEVPAVPGLFYNGLQADGKWTGDFENRDINQGKHLKTIQVLWIALHLANASEFSDSLIPSAKRSKAKQAAQRSLAFFKNYYQAHNRVDEYLSFAGKPVAECVSANNPAGCLIDKDENLLNGEARIYAQIARLALLLGDKTFAATVISDKILTDRISDKSDPRYGQIGVSTASLNDAEAWNVLESTLTLCLEAQAGGGTGSTNKAPVAKALSITTKQDTVVSYKYNATDPDGDTLSYSVVTQPQHGILEASAYATGDAGPIFSYTYRPNKGYVGTDSFTYKANDGKLDSNVVTTSITISKTSTGGVISNPVTSLTLDGDLADWSNLAAYPRDTLSSQITPANHRVDWSVAKLAHSKDALFIAYENATNIDTAKWWLWETYLDTDQDAKTGYQFNGKLGAEYVVQGSNLYRYAGAGTDWKWTYVQSLKNGVKGKFAEIAVPTDSIGKPAQINLAFFGNNASYATDGKKFYPEFDFYPNIDTGYFQYKLENEIVIPPTGSVISNPLVNPIKLDKNASDWQRLESFGVDSKDALAKQSNANHVDWESATFAHDASDLYISYKNHGSNTLDEVDTWHWEVYLDTDNNPATGYAEMNGVGADYTLQGNELYKYVGGSSNDWDKQWKFIALVDSAVSHSYSFAEYKIPRNLLGSPKGEIGVQFYGENEAFIMKSGKVTEDFFPNEGLSCFKYKM